MRNLRLYLKDIYDAINEIEEFTEGLDEKSFVNNRVLAKAVITNLIIIGEAVGKIPADSKKAFNQIPLRTWKRMKETRNELAHEYYNVKPEVLWSIVKHELPPLKPLIKQMIDEAAP